MEQNRKKILFCPSLSVHNIFIDYYDSESWHPNTLPHSMFAWSFFICPDLVTWLGDGGRRRGGLLPRAKSNHSRFQCGKLQVNSKNSDPESTNNKTFLRKKKKKRKRKSLTRASSVFLYTREKKGGTCVLSNKLQEHLEIIFS